MAKSRPPEASWSLWQVAQLFASTGCRSLSKDVRATLALGALLAGAAVLGGCEELAAKSTLPANKVTTKLGALIRVPSQRIIATIVIRQNALKCSSKSPSLALRLCPQPEAEVSDSIGVGLFPRSRRWVKSDSVDKPSLPGERQDAARRIDRRSLRVGSSKTPYGVPAPRVTLGILE